MRILCREKMESLNKNLIILYNILFFIVVVLGFPFIIPVVLLSEKRRQTVLKRLGFTSLPDEFLQSRMRHPGKKPIWVHALSVGEVLSAAPLVKGLRNFFDTEDIIFSVSTKTGFEIASEHLRDSVDAIFFFPYDIKFSVKHITGKLNPSLVIIVETDIWPNFLFEMKKRNTPVIFVNARLSKSSFVGYKRLGFFTKPLFFCFANICTQSMEDAKRFQALDVPSNRITVTGNIKFEQEFQPLPADEIEKLRQWMNIQQSQKVIVAGSTHKGEESILLEAFSMMKNDFNDLLLVVTPRDPKRAMSVYRMFESAGFSVSFLKEMEKISAGKRFDVIVVDILGILKKLYAIADIAFIGGSLVDCGGHNPLEPAIFSKPIIFGQDMSDFDEISKMLVESGGAVRVHDANSIFEAVAMLIRDDNKAIKMGQRALQVFKANKGAVEKTLKVVEAYL